MRSNLPEIVEVPHPVRTPAGWQPLTVGAGPITAHLVNGVFGDPLLEVKFKSRRERLLFDLGDAAMLSRRVLHTVTDVFLTHAHFDHICGFLHFLRARMTGEYPPCRIYGPPGTAYHIGNLIDGIAWDRIEDAGPEFHVADLAGEQTQWSLLKAGHASKQLEVQVRTDDVICRQPEFVVRCVELDHGIPVLAYALDYSAEIHVDRQRLEALRLEPGDWITDLKRLLRAGDIRAELALPNGERQDGRGFEGRPRYHATGQTIGLCHGLRQHSGRIGSVCRGLATGADLLFCEATFCAADSSQAEETRHLTTDTCAEIAVAAEVERLVPFHFSKRYTERVDDVYSELRAVLG